MKKKTGKAKKAAVPRKSDNERKTLIVPIRVNKEQKATLEAKAKRRGLGLSSWLLSLGMSAPDAPGGETER